MQGILMSIKPKWCALIANGKKTLEVRRTAPKTDVPFKVYIYETLGKVRARPQLGASVYLHEGSGMVVGEFICDRIFKGAAFADFRKIAKMACLTTKELSDYLGGKDGYGFHITAVKIYEQPRKLEVFRLPGKHLVRRPPQSWFYVEEVET